MEKCRYSHFEDYAGKEYHLNNSRIYFIFTNGKLKWFFDVECGFDLQLKLVKKE